MFWKKTPKAAPEDGVSALKTPMDTRSELLSGKQGRVRHENGVSNGYSAHRSGLDRPDNDEHDSFNDNPLARAELQELQEAAEYRSIAVTDSVNNARRIAQETQNIASQTLVCLQDQGEQIRRTTESTVKLEKELAKGEKLLNKLGPMFTPSWKTKKAAKIQGPSDEFVSRDKSDPNSDKARKDLGLDQLKTKYKDSEDPNLPVWEREKLKQDDGLDDISKALENMKMMALGMGSEMDRQDKELDTLTENTSELKSRVRQSNNRQKAILRRG